MGFDWLDTILATEEAFDIKITDVEAQQMRTVGDLYRCALRKVAAGRSRRCLTAMAFYRLRQALCVLFGHDRRGIRPSTDLWSLLPEDPEKHWRSLEEKIGLKMPEFHSQEMGLPRWLLTALITFAIVCLACPFVRFFPWWIRLLSIPTFVLAVRLFKPLAKHLSTPLPEPVGHLAGDIVARNYATIAPGSQTIDERVAWDMIVGIIADETGLKKEEIAPTSRFVEDFNVG